MRALGRAVRYSHRRLMLMLRAWTSIAAIALPLVVVPSFAVADQVVVPVPELIASHSSGYVGVDLALPPEATAADFSSVRLRLTFESWPWIQECDDASEDRTFFPSVSVVLHVPNCLYNYWYVDAEADTAGLHEFDVEFTWQVAPPIWNTCTETLEFLGDGVLDLAFWVNPSLFIPECRLIVAPPISVTRFDLIFWRDTTPTTRRSWGAVKSLY